MINEIQKLMFDQHFYARFLKGNDFDIDKSILIFKNYLQWRKQQKIDTVLVSDLLNLQKGLNIIFLRIVFNYHFRTMNSNNLSKSRSFAQMASIQLIKREDHCSLSKLVRSNLWSSWLPFTTKWTSWYTISSRSWSTLGG